MKISEVMRRVGFSKRGLGVVLRLDLTGLNSCEDVKKVADYSSSIVERMPRGSVVGVVELGSMPVTDEILQILARVTQYCSPHVMATAVVAPDASAQVCAMWVKRCLDPENMEIFSHEDRALEWLEGKGLTH